MFPILIIAIGIAVLVFGNRLPVLGAAVGALLGLTFLHLFPGTSNPLLSLVIIILLAVVGFFASGFAKGIVNIVLLVLAALAGAEIVLSFLDLLKIDLGLLEWLLAVVGGVIGVVLVRRFEGWALIILAGLIGGLLVTHGLANWLPSLQGALGTLLVLVLAAVEIAYHGGLFSRRKNPA